MAGNTVDRPPEEGMATSKPNNADLVRHGAGGGGANANGREGTSREIWPRLKKVLSGIARLAYYQHE